MPADPIARFLSELNRLVIHGYGAAALLLLAAHFLIRAERQRIRRLRVQSNRLLLAWTMVSLLAFVVNLIVALNDPEMRYATLNRISGPFASGFWLSILLTLIAPQLFWRKRWRGAVWLPVIIALFLNWYELSWRLKELLLLWSPYFIPSGWNMHPDHWFSVPEELAIYLLLLCGSNVIIGRYRE